MDTVLFTDHGILVFVITGSAIALVLSVLGLATTQQTRSDIKHQLAAVRGLVAHNERNLLKDQFQALVREGSDSIEDIFDGQVLSPLQRINKPDYRAGVRRSSNW